MSGMSPLHWAPSPEIVGDLLDAGAKLEARDQGGLTPLLWAAYFRHEETLQALLDAGSDPNATDSEGRIPLHWASSEGTVQILLKQPGPGVKAASAYGTTPLHQALSTATENVPCGD